jgi:pyruvate dehydrogenase E2 component (dihydrolipoamide acetyltransferase)
VLTEFKLPELGENIVSGTVVTLPVKPGDTIKKEQTLLELETDKASIEVPSPLAGVIKEILVKEGQNVKVGQVIMTIDTKDKASKETTTETEAPANRPSSAAHTPQATTAPSPQIHPEPKPTMSHSDAPVTPSMASPTPSSAAAKDVPAAPSVRRLARELGLDISQIPGTGPGGRISKDDIKDFAKRLITQPPSGAPIASGIPAEPLPDFSKWGTIERQPMNNIRRKTAHHLSYSWQTIPHVTQFAKADITELETLRQRYSTPQRKLTITPFLLKVLASALKIFPQFNASINTAAQEVIYKKYYHIGVAVDTERGLLVPILRDVDKKSIYQLTDELNGMAERARNKKTTLEELQGGCFTLTNLGGIGGTSFTPIVNPPEVAILGVSRAAWEQIYIDGKFVPRFLLPLSLSYDHRVIDGADGARFITWIIDAIKQPFLMELQG